MTHVGTDIAVRLRRLQAAGRPAARPARRSPEAVPGGVRAHAQPGRVRPRTHQRPAVPVDREPLAVAHHQRVGERPAVPRLGQQRGARRRWSSRCTAAYATPGRCATASCGRPAPPGAPRRVRPRPAAGRAPARRRRGPPRPHLHRQARQRGRSSPRSSPATPPRRPRSTRPPGCAAPRCSCTATASYGRWRSRATCSRRCATSPGSPRSGRSRRPSTRTWSRTGTSAIPDSARVFFTRAALPVVHHVTSAARHGARGPHAGTRCSTRPRTGCGMALARLLARQDEAAADDPAEPGRRQHHLPARRHRRPARRHARPARRRPRRPLGVDGPAQGRRDWTGSSTARANGVDPPDDGSIAPLPRRTADMTPSPTGARRDPDRAASPCARSRTRHRHVALTPRRKQS